MAKTPGLVKMIVWMIFIAGACWGGYMIWEIRFATALVELPKTITSGYTPTGRGPGETKHDDFSLDIINRARRGVNKMFKDELSLRYEHRLFEPFPEVVFLVQEKLWEVNGRVMVHSHQGKQTLYDYRARVQEGGVHKVSDVQVAKIREIR